MENNIAVGILVGLAVGTSLYVWNSDSFTKPQKIGLICCIVFPPLQWVLILLVLAYNKYQSENTTEAKITKQNVESKQNLDSAKKNLKELKEKGIITEEEFNSKVEKIESQKTAFDIKNSTEYKQLKNLLDSGILTKEEFENKLGILLQVKQVKTDRILEFTEKNLIGLYKNRNTKFDFYENKELIYSINNVEEKVLWKLKGNEITLTNSKGIEIDNIILMFLSINKLNMKFKNKIYSLEK